VTTKETSNLGTRWSSNKLAFDKLHDGLKMH